MFSAGPPNERVGDNRNNNQMVVASPSGAASGQLTADIITPTITFDDNFYKNIVVINPLKHTNPNYRYFRWLESFKYPNKWFRGTFVAGTFKGEERDGPAYFYKYETRAGIVKKLKMILPAVTVIDPARPIVVDKTVDHVRTVERVRQVIEAKNLYQRNLCQNYEVKVELADEDETMKKLLESFICPVCMEPCFPPVYRCRRSHLICGGCKDEYIRQAKMSGISIHESFSCPVCRVSTTYETPFEQLGEIVSLFLFKCKHVRFGCTKILCGSEYNQHCNDDCKFRPWKCFLCPVMVNMLTIVQHFSTTHPGSMPLIEKAPSLPAIFSFDAPIARFSEQAYVRGEDTLLKIGSFFIKNDITFFLIEMRVDPDLFAWAICCQGCPDDCKTYEADIKLTTEYDLGGGHGIQLEIDVFNHQKIVTCENEICKILKDIRTTKYFREGMAMKDFSKFLGAGRYRSTMQLRLRHLVRGHRY